MIIDSHLHLSYLKRNKNFFDIKDKLLSLMKKNNIDYAIVIPDNISNSQCADMETIFKVIKNFKKNCFFKTR